MRNRPVVLALQAINLRARIPTPTTAVSARAPVRQSPPVVHHHAHHGVITHPTPRARTHRTRNHHHIHASRRMPTSTQLRARARPIAHRRRHPHARVPGITHPHRGGGVAMSYSTITRRALARGAHRRTVASPRRSASTHDRARPMRVPGYIHMVYRGYTHMVYRGYIHTPTHRASKRRRGRRRTVARATERRWR